MPLFEIAVLEKFKKGGKDEADKKERLVYGPTAVLARDAQAALFEAVFALSASGTDGEPIDRERMEVIVRPFA